MLICTPEDLEQITGKTKYKAQLRALREMGIPHMARSTDGSPLCGRRRRGGDAGR